MVEGAPFDEHAARELLGRWEERARLALFAYNRAANRCRSWQTLLGGATAALAATVGTAVFATLGQSLSLVPRVIVGLVSVSAAVLSAIQTFAGLPDRIATYERAARRFASVRRDVEVLRCASPGSLGPADLRELQVRLDHAAEDSPNAPRRLWERTRREMKGEFAWWERVSRLLRGLPPPRRLGSGKLDVDES